MLLLLYFWFKKTTNALDVKYYDAMYKYWSKESRATKCLHEQQANRTRTLFAPKINFLTLGLEGAGHHLIMSLPESITGVKGAGHAYSYPYGVEWRKKKRKNLGSFTKTKKGLNFHKYNKVLILIRDPVDSWSSAIRRFWHGKDSLQREFEMLKASIKSLDIAIENIDCAQRFYLPYEFLTNEADLAKPALAYFLGLTSQHELNKLDEWFLHVKSVVNKNTQEKWPGPYPFDCTHKYHSLAKLLVDHAWPRNWKRRPPCKHDKEFCRAQAIYAFRLEATRQIYNIFYPGSHKVNSMPGQSISFCCCSSFNLTDSEYEIF